MQRNKHNGFTLIEVMIALSIVAVSILAFSKYIFESTKIADVQQQKTMALWVASNELTKLRVQLTSQQNVDLQQSGTAQMGGVEWTYQISEKLDENNTNVTLITISVFDQSNKLAANLLSYFPVEK